MMGGGRVRSLVMCRLRVCSLVMSRLRMCSLVMSGLGVRSLVMGCFRMSYFVMRRFIMCSLLMRCFRMRRLVMCRFGMSAFGVGPFVMHSFCLRTFVMHSRGLSGGVSLDHGVRVALIDRIVLVPVISSFLLVRALRCSRFETTISSCRLFSSGGSRLDSARTIKADVIIRRLVVDRCTVNVSVVDDRRIHVPHRRVILKGVALPSAAVETGTVIAVAVVNASIVSDLGPPITAVPTIVAIRKTPVTRGPIISRLGNLNPGAWDPEIAISSEGPVSRTPKISFLRTRRLLVSNKGWRRNCNRNTLSEQGRRCA